MFFSCSFLFFSGVFSGLYERMPTFALDRPLRGCLPARIAIRQAEIIPIDLIRIIPAEGCRIEYTLCVPAASGEAPHCGRSATCERTDIIPDQHANASYYQQPTDHMPRRYGTGCSLGSRTDPSGAHGHSRKRRSRTSCLVGRLPSVRRR